MFSLFFVIFASSVTHENLDKTSPYVLGIETNEEVSILHCFFHDFKYSTTEAGQSIIKIKINDGQGKSVHVKHTTFSTVSGHSKILVDFNNLVCLDYYCVCVYNCKATE